MKTIRLYTDASSKYNITRVGYIITLENKYITSKVVQFKYVTNNFGELKAIELALQYLYDNNIKFDNVELFTDSQVSITMTQSIINNKGGSIINSKGFIINNFNILKSIYDNIIAIDKPINLYFIHSHIKHKLSEYEYNKFKKENDTTHISICDFVSIVSFNDMCDKMVRPLKKCKTR